MKIFKTILLLLVIILLDNSALFLRNYESFQAHAEEESEKVQWDHLHATDRASSPKCGISSSVATSIMAAMGISLGSLVLAVALSASMPAMSFLISASLASIALTVTQNMMFFACRYSFVRHPVLRFKDGKYKTCKRPEMVKLGQDNNSRELEICPDHEFRSSEVYDWPRNKAPYSNYIEFCNRPVMGGLCFGDHCMEQLDFREKETFPDSIDIKSKIGGSLTCATLRDGETTNIGGVLFGAYHRGNKLCVDAIGLGSLQWWPRPEIGCHLREPMPPAPMCDASIAITDDEDIILYYDNSKCFSCYISNACYSSSALFSHSPLVMTSMVVQCIKESLENIIEGCSPSDNIQKSFFDSAKNHLHNAVKAVIVLALMLFGIKLILGAVQNGSEVLILLIKICLVFYFCIGDGIMFYYKTLTSISIGLSEMVMSSGGNKTICNYSNSEYYFLLPRADQSLSDIEKKLYRDIVRANVYHTIDDIRMNKMNFTSSRYFNDLQFDAFLSKLELNDFTYLRLWDILDCRITFYLGQSVSRGLGFTFLSALVFPLAFLFMGQIILTLASIFFIFMLLMMVLWIVHLFIISIIATAIISLFAPLFIPMCLFQATKSFFDGWLKELMAYSLYPVVLFSFMGIVFSVFDTIYFGDLTFKRVKSIDIAGMRTIYNFSIEPEDQCDDKTTNLACIVTKSNFITKPLIFGINVTAVDVWGDSSAFWKGFASLALIAFLFYHFLHILSGIAAELVGSFRADLSRSVLGADEMGKKTLAGAFAVIKGIKGRISNTNHKARESKNDAARHRELVSGSNKYSKFDE